MEKVAISAIRDPRKFCKCGRFERNLKKAKQITVVKNI
jgi:hypothetical protein